MGILAGGLLGFFIGGYLMVAKKTLPNGVRMHAFTTQTRNHGKFILILGAIAFPLWILYIANKS